MGILLHQLESYFVSPMQASNLEVCVISEDFPAIDLANFLKKNKNQIHRIDNHHFLQSITNEIHSQIRYVAPIKRARDFSSAFFSMFNFSLGEFEIGISDCSKQAWASANYIELPRAYYVYEDDITVDQMSIFVSLFLKVSPRIRPKLIFQIKNSLQSVCKMLSDCSHDISLNFVTPEGLKKLDAEASKISGLDEFAKKYTCFSYRSCSRLEQDVGGSDLGPLLQRRSSEFLSARADTFLGNKFEARPKLEKLIFNIVNDIKSAKKEDKNKLLILKCLSNLTYLYINESKKNLYEESLVIADYLESSFLSAQANRLVNIAKGYSSLSDKRLHLASDYFSKNNRFDELMWTSNNILVNSFGYAGYDPVRAGDLISLAEEHARGSERLVVLYNNVALCYLFSRQYSKSIDVMNIARNLAGEAIQMLSLEINILIAKFLFGEDISDDFVCRLITRIERERLPQNFTYHQLIMFGNILEIKLLSATVKNECYKYLWEHKLISSDAAMISPTSIFNTAFKAMPTLHFNTLPGIRGDFFKKTGLIPIVHFAWM